MKKVYKHKEKRRLHIGEIFEFLLIKRLVLPNDQEYFIIEDPYGDRHLVPTKYYKEFQLQIGSKYLFHVDKVNCKGQVFLEPLHPFYKVGQFYDFCYLKTVKKTTKKGQKHSFYLMQGRNKDYAYLEKKEGVKPNSNSWHKYKVVRIKKSQVYLAIETDD